jgi:hypothetical protein
MSSLLCSNCLYFKDKKDFNEIDKKYVLAKR